ncbi:S-adenosylmethionine:tRNA ribosyltransferase-isomerase [Poriferisphaera corsica]|uniref:S-adenosylmethionine:tRNA ribosyltransferase-isomerase n=1 Tax=Poriferisphaera corsica TaxID=2528020 RepID=A0A517YSD1_9BACT|nr:tRNA preQ1(34) S-adenosylmethionine ribosyltransferase-isomerase QueA [Poriferisphaera corsica]QDU33139.1 S-adenosylmethionine:tRNA ribosyltransferase-isomerase [Poriferisphaera corsica]
MRTDDLHFDLPDELIATQAAEPRDAAKLMVCDRASGKVEHLRVRDLADLGVFGAGDLMLVNQSRVIQAWWHGVRKGTGGKVRGLYLQPAADGVNWLTLIETRGKLQPNEEIVLAEDASLRLVKRTTMAGEWEAELLSARSTEEVLERLGSTPLPPYIRKARKHHDEAEVTDYDKTRYNTVYADRATSVAAPTAGLHFTPELLGKLEQQGMIRKAVTLDIGLGTFAPVRVGDLKDHEIHTETFSIHQDTLMAIKNAKARGNKCFVVGTTTVRAIESLPPEFPMQMMGLDEMGNGGDRGDDAGGIYRTATKLFITPDSGFEFRFTDVLMTNFHLPSSTLLALVASLPGVGLERLLEWYAIAISKGYRFYSYGDAMLIF